MEKNDPFKEFEVERESDNQEVKEVKTEQTQSQDSFDEVKILSYLSQKTGREIKTWDDVRQTEKEVIKEVPASFANEEIATLDKYVKETGRTINDYMKLQRNLSEVADKELVEEYLRVMNPTLNKDDVSELMDVDFGLEEINEEEMDEKEISELKKRNRRKELALKQEAGKAKAFFEKEKEMYKTPAERHSKAVQSGEKEWKDSMNAAISGLKSIDVGDFKYELNGSDKYAQLADLNGLINYFKNDGVTDFNKLARTIITGLEAEGIMTEYSKHVQANTREEIMKEYSNSGGTGRNIDEDAVKRGEREKKNEETFMKN